MGTTTMGTIALLDMMGGVALLLRGLHTFAVEGTVGLAPALAIMLGANVGTTLIVLSMAAAIRPRRPARAR
jgi:Na+/phosphate symporter